MKKTSIGNAASHQRRCVQRSEAVPVLYVEQFLRILPVPFLMRMPTGFDRLVIEGCHVDLPGFQESIIFQDLLPLVTQHKIDELLSQLRIGARLDHCDGILGKYIQRLRDLE